MRRSKIVFIVLLVHLMIVNSFSQENTEDKDSTAINGLYKGSWAFQFKISSNFTLNSFNGANIALKYHFSSKNALRIGVSLNTDNRSDNFDNQIIGNPLTTYSVGESDRNAYYVTVRPLYLFYPKVNKKVSFYLGAGLVLGYGYNKYETNNKTFNGDTLIAKTYYMGRLNSYSIGFSMIGGVEIFVTKYLSLHAEYGSDLSYDYSEEKRERTEESVKNGNKTENVINNNQHKYYFRPSNVLFGVSVYF